DHSMPPPPERFAEIVISQDPPKVIRFPRPQVPRIPTVEEVRLDELQEPMHGPPRIFEAMEPEAFEPEAFEAEALEPEAVEPPAEAYRGGPEPSVPSPVRGQQLDLLPSFADIRLEPEETRIDTDLEIIPRPAPLAQRVVSGLVDAGLVVIATG